MAEKEKFDRSLEHVNIGTIGHVDHGKTTLTAATRPSAPPGRDGISGPAPLSAPRWSERSMPPPGGPSAPPRPVSDGRWSRWSQVLKSSYSYPHLISQSLKLSQSKHQNHLNNRRDEQHAVETVQHTAVLLEQMAVVLDAELPLDEGKAQIG